MVQYMPFSLKPLVKRHHHITACPLSFGRWPPGDTHAVGYGGALVGAENVDDVHVDVRGLPVGQPKQQSFRKKTVPRISLNMLCTKRKSSHFPCPSLRFCPSLSLSLSARVYVCFRTTGP